MADGMAFTGADAITFTCFRDYAASEKWEVSETWEELAHRIRFETKPRKDNLPWLKLARFGSQRTDKGSLRHDANVLAITGIEGDYDGEQHEPAYAVEKLHEAGVRAMVYTSPSHTEDTPRWRVLCPTSTPLPPEQREHLMGRLNGVLGGILSGESFTLSQAYFYGSVKMNPSHVVELVEGRPIDLCGDLDAGWMGKPSTGESATGADGKPRAGRANQARLVEDIVSGEAFHASTLRLAGAWAFAGVSLVDARERIWQLFDTVPEDQRGDRWSARRGDVERCLLDVYGKEGAKKDKPKAKKPAAALAGHRREETADDFELTEDGVAIRFAEQHGHEFRFCHDTGKWFVWTGTHWQLNRDRLAFQAARELVRALNRSSEFKTKAITGKVSFAGGVETFAQRDRVFAVTAAVWDKNNTLLGTPGGTVDLVTGQLRPAKQEDFITRVTAVAPAGTADCPAWLAFLKQATASDDDLIRFLQQWCGYCLTGSTREHALLFIYGPGGNGKSVFLNTVAGILGDYHQTAAMDTFTEAGGRQHLTFLAMMRGARMVTASETEEGRAWAESRIKQMTGGDPITANVMRHDPFTFLPNFKLTIAGNHKPALKSVDDAARRRFNIVPFLHKPAQPDRQLEAKLKKEWPGIMRWMIEGCLDWQKHGLVRPAIVTEATEEYFEAQDVIGRWMAERCILVPHLVEKPGNLASDCREWAMRNGEAVPTPPQVRSALEKVPGVSFKKVKGDRQAQGIGLRPPENARQGAQGA
jgi:putative DNA primase/helicase